MLNTELLPTQVVFLQNFKKLKIYEVLSFVIRDLIIRKVLILHKKNTFPNNRSRKTQKYFMLAKGPNYLGYEPQDFEKNLVSPLEDIDSIQIKTLTNFVLKKYSMPSAYIRTQILAPLRNAGYINNIPIAKIFGIYSLTPKAKEIVTQASEQFQLYEEKLTQLIDGDKEAFYQIVKEMGTYIFTYELSNPELYKNIESMIRRIFINKPLGADKLLEEYFQAMNLNLGFFHE